MKPFNWRLQGKCHKLGHDVVHDGVMMNFKYVMDRVTDPAVLIPHLFEDSDPGFKDRVKPGDIIVAGRNLGKGKAHVQAYVAMQGLGLGVVCESMPFLTYRGAIASGLMLMAECKGVTECAENGDDLDVDFRTGKFVNRTRGIERMFPPVPEGLRETIELGGTEGVIKAWWEKQKKETA
jgi:3-isopropylmalate/(R)-2-methylmalate dehydratase small subunit